MTATASPTDFLHLLRKSGLMDAQDLNDYLATIAGYESMPPAELAGRFVADGKLTAFQQYHLLKGRYKNFFIGKYKVLQPLGRGGMSQVFLCEHTIMRHRVALKLLPVKDSSDAASVGRFMREARAAAAVNHPNVVRAHDVDKADGKIYYLVMDYIDGVNLHDLVKLIGPLPPEQAANYIAQAAVGLQEIADKGLIHRDLKPSNFILDRDGVIRILDLGLARFADDESANITQKFKSETVFGTADYLAPEQALQMPDVDSRADIYSLGATLYFLLSGEAPYESASTTQKLLAHQMRDADPIDGIPKELNAVIAAMMKKKPAERLQCAMDVVEALAPWASLPLPLPPEDWFPTATNTGPVTNAPPSTAGHGKTLVSQRGFAPNRFAPSPTSDILRSMNGRMPSLADSMSNPPRKTHAIVYILAAIVLIVGIGTAYALGVFSNILAVPAK